jgi:hypothetical protein
MSAQILRPPVGDPPAIQWVGVGQLLIEPSYQRAADSRQSQRMIGTIAANWDWRLCQPLMVSRRADALWVIDGQHRLLAARARGDLPHLPCSVASYDDAAQEAEVFVRANQGRKALTVLDLFRASCASGDGWANQAAELIEDAGLSVSTHTNTAHLAPGALINVRGVIEALKRHGEPPVRAALATMGKAFGDQQMRQGGMIFEALLQLAIHPPEGLSYRGGGEALVTALQTRSAADWTSDPDVATGPRAARIQSLAAMIRAELTQNPPHVDGEVAARSDDGGAVSAAETSGTIPDLKAAIAAEAAALGANRARARSTGTVVRPTPSARADNVVRRDTGPPLPDTLPTERITCPRCGARDVALCGHAPQLSTSVFAGGVLGRAIRNARVAS